MNNTIKKKVTPKLNKLHKSLTGIKGFDEVTEGGLRSGVYLHVLKRWLPVDLQRQLDILSG